MQQRCDLPLCDIIEISSTLPFVTARWTISDNLRLQKDESSPHYVGVGLVFLFTMGQGQEAALKNLLVNREGLLFRLSTGCHASG